MRKRIGGERAEGDEPQRDAVAEMIERQPVIGGKRRIGDKRRTDREQPAFERYGLEARQEFVESRPRSSSTSARTEIKIAASPTTGQKYALSRFMPGLLRDSPAEIDLQAKCRGDARVHQQRPVGGTPSASRFRRGAMPILRIERTCSGRGVPILALANSPFPTLICFQKGKHPKAGRSSKVDLISVERVRFVIQG